MKPFLLGLSDDLRAQIKKAASQADVTETTFIRESIQYRLRNLSNDYSSWFKDTSFSSSAPSTWDKVVLVPLLEVLYYERLKVDDKTKADALKKADSMQKKIIAYIEKGEG